MVIKSIARLLCNSASICVLLALLLTSYLANFRGNQTENIKISRDDNTTYPETTTPQGIVRGINMVTHYNRTVFGFIGIPYAQPPVGNLRFKAPVSADAWSGTLNATSDSEPCPQVNAQGEITGNEDCLYLNVFTPKLLASNNSALLPVMVYIIGGAFRVMNNSIYRFGPDFLLDEDVVLVIPNFRVGMLGFLSTGDEVSPGNYGLKDIVQALKWIQNSIQSFGGDPNQVTLFGGSSGATSIHLLATSNSTNGLFHKYITQSGTSLLNYVNQPREVHVNRAIQLGEYFGCPANSSTLLVDCLRSFNASQLIDTDSLFYVWRTFPRFIWTPAPEPDIEGALLTDIPANLCAIGKIRDLPWLASGTRDEGLSCSIEFYEDSDLYKDFLENIDLALPLMLGYKSIVNDVTAYTNALKSYYLNDLTANKTSLLTNLTNLLGDALFNYPTYKAIQHWLVFAKSPLYFCSLEYRGTFSYSYFFSRGSVAYTGVVHGDELIYLFENHDNLYGPSEYEYSDTDYTMVDTIVQLWTSFVINGTPTTMNSVGSIIWKPYSSLNNYLRIGNGSDTALEIKYDLLLERMQFWDELTAATTG